MAGLPGSVRQRGSKGKRKLEIYVFVCSPAYDLRSALALARARARRGARARATEFGMQFVRPRWPLSTPLLAPIRSRPSPSPSLPAWCLPVSFHRHRIRTRARLLTHPLPMDFYSAELTVRNIFSLRPPVPPPPFLPDLGAVAGGDGCILRPRGLTTPLELQDSARHVARQAGLSHAY